MWLVTGYSGKRDGLAYVVEAEDGKSACEKVAKLNGMTFKQIDFDGGCADILYHGDEDIQDHIDGYNMGDGPRRCHELYYEPVTLDHNLHGAVCW